MTAQQADDAVIWGYIEGYYGRLFGWEERASLIDHIAAQRFPGDAGTGGIAGKAGKPWKSRTAWKGGGAYLYAPKEDAFHRQHWRTRYPAEWRNRFAKLAAHAAGRGVELVPGMAPGLSFDYLSFDDYRILLSKFRDFLKLGCRSLALLMDDIPPVLPENCGKVFRTLGHAHGELLMRLLGDLRAMEPECRLWFCPTVYTDQFASGPPEKDPYLLDLAATMPKDIPLMWTGPRIIAERLDAGSLRSVAKMFGGNVLLWDNLYANDYCPNKLFVGPYHGRSKVVWTKTRGLLLNPTGLPATDRLLLDLLADFRRGRAAKSAWKDAMVRYALPKEFLVVAPFLASPFFRPNPADIAPKRIQSLHKALKTLIWDWKGLLHQEWYPYLFMLDADLKASAKGEDGPDEAWVRKRYSPLVADLILRRAP
ncbi:MAG: beta-N-acetylglucosaminidase domain-containing protein [Fibrobacteria bacterium]